MYKTNIVEAEKRNEENEIIQEVKKEIFKLVDMIDEKGQPVKVQVSVGIYVLSNLENQITALEKQKNDFCAGIDEQIADLEEKILSFNN